jgi:hydroxymethylglutaryl-CoA lyase
MRLDQCPACGRVREIEVGSFVPAKLLPQMADVAEVVRHAVARHPHITVMALAPNLRGAEAALQAGAHKVTLPVSASEAHSLANVRKTPAAMVQELQAVVQLRADTAPHALIEVGLSTAFGCTLQGAVPEDDVIRLAVQCAEAGVDEVGLSDTTGMANPAQVRRLFTRLRAELGPKAGAAHMHNTRGLGLANCLAAYDVGVRTFDASQGGLGGCPYAPGASGNVVTEDLVFMFEAMGIATGVDRLLRHVQPQQEEPGGGRERRMRPRDRAAPGGRCRCLQRELQGRHHGQAGLRPRGPGPLNPRLIYVSHKGFLPGPYEHRTALDEVVQMMGGLAYMTGPEGRPLRAGASVNDIMGGMFGAIGALAALHQRDKVANGTGKGQAVQSALFENNVFLVAQHMMQFAVTGKPAAPMPSRISAWAVYDVFTVKGGEQVFLAAVSDTQWALLCEEFGFTDLLGDARLASNNDRVRARDWMLPVLRERFAPLAATELAQRFERIGLPYAPITRPEDLFDDPHLQATGGLASMSVPADASSAGQPIETRAALLPLSIGGQRLPLRFPPPSLGAQTDDLLRSLGYADPAIAALREAGVIG